MKYLIYPLYNYGHCGWSNAVMSLDCGVALANLTNRVLVIKGNQSPPANLIGHKELTNQYRANVTDLYDIPTPWIELDQFELIGIDQSSKIELTSRPLYDIVFYLPEDLDTTTNDFVSFANNRKKENFVTYRKEHQDQVIIELTNKTTLANYSYIFYLQDEWKKKFSKVMSRMVPKKPYLDFADTICKKLGKFNAMHIRLGDFRVTYGVTTKLRTAKDVLKALDNHFSPDDTLVICTDESQNTDFFNPILDVYKNSIFIDLMILQNPEISKNFFDLPYHDDMALALVSQLVAANSMDFIGSMTSTYSAMIQRMRGIKRKKGGFQIFVV